MIFPQPDTRNLRVGYIACLCYAELNRFDRQMALDRKHNIFIDGSIFVKSFDDMI